MFVQIDGGDELHCVMYLNMQQGNGPHVHVVTQSN